MDAALLAIAVGPPVASAVWFYRRDREREPLGAVLRAFLAGALVVVAVLVAVVPIARMEVRFEGHWLQGAYAAFLLAAVPEELAKYLFLRRHIRSHHCDEPMDGLLYGALVSLGFAAVENVLYVLQGGFWTGAFRAVTAVPMHASCGALMGLALARGKLFGAGPGRGLLPALTVPIVIHGLYDWPLLALHDRDAVDGVELLAAFGGSFAVLAWSVVRVRRHSAALRAMQG